MKWCIVLILGYACLGTQAQSTVSVVTNLNLPTVALLDIEPSNASITLALQAPVQAGSPVTIPSNNTSKWLNFTSAITTGGSRRITAQITAGAVPTGVRLKLNLGSYTGVGAGTLGTPLSNIYLSTTSQNIVTGIGAAYTGTGSTNGYNLTYSLEIDNYGQLRHNLSNTVTITYTITDN
ncbi:hypothetical protein [Runella zeae]|uniref:hypothetical protein n=1 Tax=Runella zeae TaxID=94255 RepID=UPI000688D973|nr:hypothetical protein [Runella zeae]